MGHKFKFRLRNVKKKTPLFTLFFTSRNQQECVLKCVSYW